MSFNPTAPASLMQAQVIGIQPPNKLLVLVPAWGAGTRVPVTVLGIGQNDALRTNLLPLPKLGTWGVIGFLHQDSRNGMWLGSFPPALANAMPTIAGDSDITYASENSGHWHYRDGDGNDCVTWADGSSLTISQTGIAPVPNRTVVENQAGVSQALTQAQRATIKAPMTFTLATASGVSLTIEGSTATLTGILIVDGPIIASGNIIAGSGGEVQVDLLNHKHNVANVQAGSTTIETTSPVAGT